MLSNTGFAAAKAFGSPPAMKVSVAPLAPPVPPDTGASTEAMPCLAARPWARTALSTSMVEQSMISAPLAIAGNISVHTERTCLPAGSIVMTTSAPFHRGNRTVGEPPAIGPGLLARVADQIERHHLWPALTRLAAIGPPILPRPMNAMLAISNSLRSDVFVLSSRTPVRRHLSLPNKAPAFQG